MTATSLLDAIAIVKQNEKLACEAYLAASRVTRNPVCKQLFIQLSAFERYHYLLLATTERFLQDRGGLPIYDVRDFPLPPQLEIKAATEVHTKSVMKIISEVMDLKRQTERAYTRLAAQIKDPTARKTFFNLAREESSQFSILSEAYWTLNDLGTWKWARP
jgi:rubrerythrin